MAIPFNTLMDEAKCYLCLGVTQAEALELALLNRIASGGYQEYVAIVNQAGVTAPVSTVLSNTLIGTPVWSYAGPGHYILTLAGGFPLSKTVMFFSPESTDGEGIVIMNRTNNSIEILIGAGDDGFMVNQSLLIRVYP